MPNIKNIKTKIDSVSNMKQLFYSMESSGTDKIKKLNKQISSYQSFMWDFFSIIWSIWWWIFNVVRDDSKKKLCLLFSSNKWLCWNCNDKLFKKVFLEFWNKKDKVDIFCIWKKSFEYFVKKWFNVVWYIKLDDCFVQNDLSEVYDYVFSSISSDLYWEISVYSNFMRSKVSSKIMNYNVFPVEQSSLWLFMNSIWLDLWLLFENTQNVDVLWDSEEMKMVVEKQLIQYMIYWVALQNKLAELSTRVSLIQNMKDSTDFIVKDLKLSFNKLYQSLLTREISNIMNLKTEY